MAHDTTTLKSVQEYYGKVLKSSSDLKTNACCSIDSMAKHVAAVARELHPEVRDRFYGCGTPIPYCLEGAVVLDLGCGSGRDCFVMSKLVGEKGRVIGVDMTEEQLAVANKHVAFHTDKFGYKKPNVEFKRGYIEDLKSLGIADGSVDVVVSNCVLNLSPAKPTVFSEIFRVLKPGGELYFSDIFSGRRIPKALAQDPILLGECLGGALYFEDFRRLMSQVGFLDHRVVERGVVTINNPEIEARAGMIDFHSCTIRAFKADLEDRCEDYGQVAYYLGTIPESPHKFLLDDHHLFRAGMPMTVCGNTAAMVSGPRYGKHFKVVGDRSVHYGLFDCAPSAGQSKASESTGGGCC